MELSLSSRMFPTENTVESREQEEESILGADYSTTPLLLQDTPTTPLQPLAYRQARHQPCPFNV